MSKSLEEGALAGAAVAADLGFNTRSSVRSGAAGRRCDPEGTAASTIAGSRNSRTKAFVDFQNDVTQEDIALAAREGFRSPELVKRYTTLGMATDQGKLSNINGHAVLAEVTQRATAELGLPPFDHPTRQFLFGALAGEHRAGHFRPTRFTAGHEWARQQGAVFIETGAWLRAQWFPRTGDPLGWTA